MFRGFPSSTYLIFGCVVLACTLPGCGQKAQHAPAGPASSGKSDESATDTGNAGISAKQAKNKPPKVDALSAQECQAFADAMSRAVEQEDPREINALIDWTQLVHRTMADVEISDKLRQEFITGVLRGVETSPGLAGEVIAATHGNGTYKLLRIRDLRGAPHAIFRMLMSDQGGVNYHEYRLMRDEQGKVVASDVYVHTSGEYMSTSMRRPFVAAVAHENRGFLDRLTGAESAFVQRMPDLQRMVALVREGKPQEAAAIYATLPAELQQDKSIMLINLRAAQAMGEEPYLQAIADLRKHHPNDVAIDLVSLDYYFASENFDEALSCIERLDKSLEGDAYLQVLRSGILLVRDEVPAAREAAESAVRTEPTLTDAHYCLIACGLKQQDYPLVANELLALERELNEPIGDLTMAPEYAGFVASEHYQKWLDARGVPAASEAVE